MCACLSGAASGDSSAVLERGAVSIPSYSTPTWKREFSTYVCIYVCMYTPSTYISMNLSTCAYIFTILPHSYCILYGNQVSSMYVCRMSWNGRRGSSGMQIGAFLIGGDIYCMGRRAEERLRYLCMYVCMSTCMYVIWDLSSAHSL